jgi:heterodisulfide reductase subunit A
MADESPRVGVFICDCGSNIAGLLDVPALVEFSRGLPDVVVSEEGKWICSVDYLNKIKEAVREHDLNRVVVACCTPRTHEPTFKSTVREAGLNPFLLEFVSIREQVSWVHKEEASEAQAKARDLIRMGVAKARLLGPGEEIRLPVGKEGLVIGGGIAGMTAALGLADQGFHVILVEKEEALGGILRRIGKVAPEDTEAYSIVMDRIEAIKARGNIRVLTNAELVEVRGYVGNFQVTLAVQGKEEVVKVSTMIVATGMKAVEPHGVLGYGTDPKVITHLQLEGMLKEGKASEVGSAAIITCVGSRNGTKGCCAIGCLSSVKNAKALRQANKEKDVYILHRNLNITGDDIAYEEDAVREQGIGLIRYPDGNMPEVTREDGKLAVVVDDVLLGRRIKLKVDTIVLVTGYEGDPLVEKLKGLLKVSTNSEGFFQEAHVKLRPLDFANDGIYLAGAARYPKGVRETVLDALGAAMRASIPMKRGYIEAEGIVSEIDYENCIRCGLCSKNCPYGAIELVEGDGGEKPLPKVIQAICKGCGVCAADCPKDAIDIVHYRDAEILAQVDAALTEDPGKKVVAFACHWCAMGAVDMAGVGRMQYPSNIRLIRLMCSGRVDKEFISRAFERGAGGVLVAGCDFPTCHYITGNYKCQDRVEKLRRKLEKEGVDVSRLWTVWLSAADGPKWVTKVKEMVRELGL